MKIGDIFRWSWKNPKSQFAPYHCCSCIAEFTGTLLRDTYWSGMSSGKQWTPEEAEKQLDLTFIANRDDLLQMNPDVHHYYDEKDVVDLRHPNNSSRSLVYIRDGAQRSAERMAETVDRTIRHSLSDIAFANNRIERCRESLKEIEAGNLDIYIEIYRD